MAKTTRRREGEDTSARILASAAKHFGAYGYQGASLRAILTDADTNTAAGNYHFGSKAGLYTAVISDYFNRTRTHRLALFDAAETQPAGRMRLRAVTEAYMRPHIELVIGEGEHAYGRLVLRMLGENDSGDVRTALEDNIKPIQQRYRDALRRCCPHIDDEQLTRGIGYVLAVLIHAPFNTSYSLFTGRSPLDEPVESVLATAADFATGGLVQLFGLTDA